MPDFECNPIANSCYADLACSNYFGTDSPFVFKINLLNEGDNDYIRVPLETFATEDSENGGCILQIEYSPADTLVLGGMFFQEFYGLFTNQYNVDTSS